MAEGDSWFDYPWKDVLSCLEDEHGYDVESVAHKGDHVEQMAYDGGQLVQFLRRLERLLLRQNKIPKAVLLSGGNDFASVGLKGNRLQKRLAGSYFAAFSTNRTTIGLQNSQNLPSPSHFFASILQVRQAAGRNCGSRLSSAR
jgi:hypothetical protein